MVITVMLGLHIGVWGVLVWLGCGWARAGRQALNEAHLWLYSSWLSR